MTQPQTADPGVSGGQVLATTALALALIAIEEQVRTEVNQAIATAFETIAATAILVAAAAPATILTGLALISTARFHTTLTGSLTTAATRVTTAVRAAYTAAAQTAATHTAAQLGTTPTITTTDLGTTVDTLSRDITLMFGHAQTDIQNNVRLAFDGVGGDNPHAARTIAIRQAILNTQASLTNRATATATTAVQRAATDAQQAAYTQYQTSTGTSGLMKRWKTTSANPCGMCEALNGTLVGINAEFDARATTVDKDLRPVWRNLSGPPRHPNCRCQLELVTT